MSILQNLTEGLVNRDLAREGQAILNKWEATGLLEGLESARSKESMSLLLENQAKELLREASSMAAGDVEGFASVAFPIVRRVFGNLFANDLVSVQPMSLPSGLVFFLDFTFEGSRAGYLAGDSIYGGNVVGRGLVDGVDLVTNGGGGMYNLNTGYSSPTGSYTTNAEPTLTSNDEGNTLSSLKYDPDLGPVIVVSPTTWTAAGPTLSQVSPDLTTTAVITSMGGTLAAGEVDATTAAAATVNEDFTKQDDGSFLLQVTTDTTAGTVLGITVGTSAEVIKIKLRQVRRHTDYTVTNFGTEGLSEVTNISRLVFSVTSVTLDDVEQTITQAILDSLTTTMSAANSTAGKTYTVEAAISDNFDAAQSLGAVVGSDTWGLEEPLSRTNGAVGQRGNVGDDNNKNEIGEIDIKVDSVAVTAVTKKLKAKWSQELGQDLSAYHNLDAEVELTGILSEQIALEIDREILNDLIQGAKAGTYYWSRRPGRFVDRTTGSDISSFANESLLGADFTGTVSEWYETLIETINDLSAQIHRKVLRGGANFVVTSPEVANLLEFTSGFRASVTHSDEKGTIGGIKAGSISKKFDVYVDPYFPRNLLLVGRNGSSFLESGYVYAPYVPLQVTPTIFGTEDFVPRKGVLTRYAKKMVRPDMYGLVVVKDLIG